ITNWIGIGLYCRRDNNLYLADYESTNVFFKGFRHLIILQRTWPFSATVLSRTISLGCYQGPRDVLLALSPFAVDSRPLATVIVSILHALRSLTTSLSFTRPR